MEYRGKRQSTNIIDLRSFKSISIEWLLTGGTNFPAGSLVIDSDGTTYGTVNYNNVRIYLIPAQAKPVGVETENWFPKITSGQVRAVRRILSLLLTVYKGSLQVNPPVKEADTYLVQMIYILLDRF